MDAETTRTIIKIGVLAAIVIFAYVCVWICEEQKKGRM